MASTTETDGDTRLSVNQTYRKRMDEGDRRAKLEERLLRWLQGQRDIEAGARREQIEDQRFYEGKLTHYDAMAREMPQLRDLTVNIIRQSCNYLGGIAKDRMTNGGMSITGSTGYSDTSEMMQVSGEFERRLAYVQQMTEVKSKMGEAIDSAVEAGVGYLHQGVRPSRENGRLQFFVSVPYWRNVYADSGVHDIADAEFVFLLKPMDAERMGKYYPSARKQIKELRQEFELSHAADDEHHFHHPFDAGRYQSYSAGTTGVIDRYQVIHGTVYYRDTVSHNGRLIDIILHCEVAVDRGLERLRIISDPTFLGHSRPPVCRICHTQDRETRLPYSSIVRDRRGLARTMNALLRNMTKLIASRALVVNMHGLKSVPNMDSDGYLRDLAKRISQPSFVIPEYGDPGSTKIENLSTDIEKMTAGIGMMMQLAKNTSGVHQALLGERSNVEAASAFESLKSDAATNVSTFFDQCDMKGTKPLNEFFLSDIEKYNGHIDWGFWNRGNQIIQISSDMDYTIAGNRAIYHVYPSNRDEMVRKSFQDIMQALISKLDPSLALPLYQQFIKSVDLPDGQMLIDDLKAICAQAGFPSLPSTMSEEEKAAQQQQQQQQQQMQTEVFMANLQKLTAETQKLQADAYAAKTNADQPDKSDKMRDQEETIRDQYRELMAYKQQLNQQGAVQ